MKKKKMLYYGIGIPVLSLILWLLYYIFLFELYEFKNESMYNFEMQTIEYSNRSEPYFIGVLIIIAVAFLLFLIKATIEVLTPMQWRIVTVTNKHKKYAYLINPRSSGGGGYLYWIEFLFEEGQIMNYQVREDLYVFLVEGAKVKILCNSKGIRTFELLEDIQEVQ